MKTMASIRDILMPGISQISNETGRYLDLAIDYTTDSIILLSSAGSKVLFTRKEIDDGIVPKEFGPRVMEYIE